MSSHTPPSTVFLALERQSYELLQALPAAIYVTDAAGRITFYNEAAAELWGQHPELERHPGRSDQGSREGWQTQ